MDPHLSLSLAAGLRHGWDFAHVPSGLGLGFFSVPSFFFLSRWLGLDLGDIYTYVFFICSLYCMYGVPVSFVTVETLRRRMSGVAA